jgi:hypothetical protein
MRRRFVFFPLFLGLLAFLSFLRTAGAERVRPVQIVSLIATGVCLGVGVAHLRAGFDARSRD